MPSRVWDNPGRTRIAARAACAFAAALAAAGCNNASAPAPGAPGTIEIVPVSGSVFEGDTVHLAARVFDRTGAADPAAPVLWTVSDPALARVVDDSLLALLQPGTVGVTATSGPVTARYDLPIRRLVVQRVELTPETITMGRTDRLPVAALVLGQGDRVIRDRPVTFTSDDTLVGIIAEPGSPGSVTSRVVVAVGPGSTTIRASVDGVTGTAQLGVVAMDTTFVLAEYNRSPLPVLVLADTVVIDGRQEFNELYADSGTLVLSGLLQTRYELEVDYAVYHAIRRGNAVQRELRFRLRGEHDQGLVAAGPGGSLSLVSELIGPRLEHTATVQPDGYQVRYRIAGTDSTLDLRYGAITPPEDRP